MPFYLHHQIAVGEIEVLVIVINGGVFNIQSEYIAIMPFIINVSTVVRIAIPS
jgi:hypothetical protein